jgi:hypothetical protein
MYTFQLNFPIQAIHIQGQFNYFRKLKIQIFCAEKLILTLMFKEIAFFVENVSKSPINRYHNIDPE